MQLKLSGFEIAVLKTLVEAVSGFFFWALNVFCYGTCEISAFFKAYPITSVCSSLFQMFCSLPFFGFIYV